MSDEHLRKLIWRDIFARFIGKRSDDVRFEDGDPPRLVITAEGVEAREILRTLLDDENQRERLVGNPLSPRLAICLTDGRSAPRVAALFESYHVRLVSGTDPIEGEPPLRAPTGEDFAAWFVRRFAVKFPRPDIAAGMCFVREDLWSSPPLRPGQVSGLPWCLRALGPPHYRLAGFWGLGGNSDAGYYTRVEGSVKVLLRVGHGGPFRDRDRTGEAIHREVLWAEDLADRAIARGIALSLRHEVDTVRLDVGGARFAGPLEFTVDGPIARTGREELDRCLAALPG